MTVVVLIAERIQADVTREPAHLQRVVVCLGLYYERAVLGVVPVAGAILLQVEPQLVAVVGCQLTESIVAEPVVAAWITKSHFVVRPRTIHRAKPVVLLNQQCGAVGCNTVINERSSKMLSSLQSDSQSAYCHILCAYAEPYFVFLSVAYFTRRVYLYWYHFLFGALCRVGAAVCQAC